ncbi:MAG: trigger factor [Clostridia bacterium]|nr:trigger factor [Clostridia bacterium]
MEITENKVSSSQINFEAKFTKEEFDSSLVNVYNKNKSKYFVQGFRKGKVPYAILLKQFGKEFFYEDAIDYNGDIAYKEILEKIKDKEFIDRPQESIKSFDDNGLVLEFSFFVNPDVELGQYTKLGLKKEAVEVTDKDIEDRIQKELESRSRMVEKDEPAELGDTVKIDYEGSVDGVKFDGGSAEDYSLELGSNTFIPGFEDQVVGMKRGDVKDINVTFPENYPASKELEGKPAIFKVTVKEVAKKELPTFDDDFIMDIDEEVDNVEQWKEKIKKQIFERKDKEAEDKLTDDIIKHVVETSKVDIPKKMIDDEIDYKVNQMEQQYSAYGLKLKDMLAYQKQTIDEFKETLRADAENNVKTRLCFEAIIKKENIQINMEEVNKLLEDYKDADDKTRARAFEYIANQNIYENFVKFLKENN